MLTNGNTHTEPSARLSPKVAFFILNGMNHLPSPSHPPLLVVWQPLGERELAVLDQLVELDGYYGGH